jgi:hypothetical protein
LPVEVRQELLDAIYSGQSFRTVFRDLGLTSNQVFGRTKTDEEWSTTLEAALTASRRSDLRHGTNAAYVHGCVCKRVPGASAGADGQEPEMLCRTQLTGYYVLVTTRGTRHVARAGR